MNTYCKISDRGKKLALFSADRDSGVESQNGKSAIKRFLILLCTPEPKFLLPGAAPVVLGSALGFGVTGSFDLLPAFLAMTAMAALNAGANMVNDYYDHLSGNDWLNENPSEFGGGSRYIQKGIVKPKQMLAAGLISLAAGSAIGLLIVWMTESLFILSLGVIGVLGGFFWTAPPVKWCYRYVGEPYIFLLFGLLPVYGAYYLQTGTIDILPVFPGTALGLLIANVALINSFPDMKSDAAVEKLTFVVRYGMDAGVKLFRSNIILSYLIAAVGMFFSRTLLTGGIFYLLTLPLAFLTGKFANTEELSQPGSCRANKLMIIFHSVAVLLMSAGFVSAKLLWND